MSPDPAHVLPSKWTAFLKEVDRNLQDPVELHCLGGFVLSALYDLPRPTGDVDYIAAMPANAVTDLQNIAGQGFTAQPKVRAVFPARHCGRCSRRLCDPA